MNKLRILQKLNVAFWVLLPLLFVSTLYAQSPTNNTDEAEEQIGKAWAEDDWANFIRYSVELIFQTPEYLDEDTERKQQLLEALNYAISQLGFGLELCKTSLNSLENFVSTDANCDPSVTLEYHVNLGPKPPLNSLPDVESNSNSSAEATFLCRGGEDISFAYTAGRHFSRDSQLELEFTKLQKTSSSGAGSINVQMLKPSECFYMGQADSDAMRPIAFISLAILSESLQSSVSTNRAFSFRWSKGQIVSDGYKLSRFVDADRFWRFEGHYEKGGLIVRDIHETDRVISELSLDSSPESVASTATPTATPTHLPTPTKTPVPRLTHRTQTPKQVVERYYQAINNRQYKMAWGMLSEHFKDLHNCCTARGQHDFGAYTQWWDKVKSVEIERILTIRTHRTAATIQANLRYTMKNGRVIIDPEPFIHLQRDSASGDWLFFDKDRR